MTNTEDNVQTSVVMSREQYDKLQGTIARLTSENLELTGRLERQSSAIQYYQQTEAEANARNAQDEANSGASGIEVGDARETSDGDVRVLGGVNCDGDTQGKCCGEGDNCVFLVSSTELAIAEPSQSTSITINVPAGASLTINAG